MSRIAFVTDSSANLPEELIKRQGITIVPVYVIFGEQSFKDYVEISPADFYRRLAERKASGQEMPKTSQPPPEDFRATYASLAERGYTDIIVVTVTAKASGTFRSAEMAKELAPNVNVHVVDSATTSMHMGFMLLAAIEAVEKGGGVAEALAAIEQVKSHSCLHFTVTEVEHLAASGRTEGREKATEAEISVKPIVSVVDGVPKAVGTERTQRAALEKVLELTRQRMGDGRVKRMAVVNGNIADKADQWAGQAAEALGFKDKSYVVDFGPALAVHFGPGLLGVTVEWE